MTGQRGGSRFRIPVWVWWVAGGVAVIGVALAVAAARLGPIVKQRALHVLEERYQSQVTLGAFHLALFPRVSVTGENLTFRHYGDTDRPPLVTIRKFVVHASVPALLATPMRIGRLQLEGLVLHVPHKGSGPPNPHNEKVKTTTNSGSSLLIIDEIDADGTLLEILPKTAGKEPLDFEIKKLQLHSIGKDRPMEFKATLTNAKPPGLIQSSGHFGPWQNEDPGATPLDGHYTFDNADLGVFSGISGILSSTGDYKGILQRIEVSGTTDTPDFLVKTSDNKVHLVTDFQAIVDGTDGDTYLQPVNAHFLQTSFTCQGKVEGVPGVKGKTIALDVVTNGARIEDLLRLAVKGNTPIMTGSAQFHAKFVLPPGDSDVMQRLELAGKFGVLAAHFTSEGIQGKVAEFSRRSQGRMHDEELQARPESVASNLTADLNLKDATARFKQLAFSVPGADVQLTGSYGLRSEQIQFTGVLRMQARLSQTTTGWKSLLLKAVDPFFAKDGAGAVVPIKIEGTREYPKFGLNLHGK